jgi:hypothetical protein
VKLIEVQPLPFGYQQDQLLSSRVPSDSALITYVLASPITLTHLTSLITDPLGLPLTAAVVSSDFVGDGYNFVWYFTAEAGGWHTVTLHADEFMSPFVRRVLAATARIYLPIVWRDY